MKEGVGRMTFGTKRKKCCSKKALVLGGPSGGVTSGKGGYPLRSGALLKAWE